MQEMHVSVSTVTASQDVARVQWQEARNDFKNKYAQFEQSEEREEENVGQKCVWVLWYDESVIAGLDLSQSCCFKETSFTLLLWSVIAV